MAQGQENDAGWPVTLDETVHDILARRPAARRILAERGLELCCGGVHPLGMAAAAHGVDAAALLAELNAAPGREILLDVRGLEPPQPMVEILSKVPELGPGDVLVVEHFREPVPLYPHLEAAGCAHSIEKLGEGRFLLRVWRRA